jgi:hypothetical protein
MESEINGSLLHHGTNPVVPEELSTRMTLSKVEPENNSIKEDYEDKSLGVL